MCILTMTSEYTPLKDITKQTRNWRPKLRRLKEYHPKDCPGITRDTRDYFSLIKRQTKSPNYKIQLLPDIVKAITFYPFISLSFKYFYLHPCIYDVGNHNFQATPLSEDVRLSILFLLSIQATSSETL